MHSRGATPLGRPIYLMENSFSIWGFGLAKLLSGSHSGGVLGAVHASREQVLFHARGAASMR